MCIAVPTIVWETILSGAVPGRAPHPPPKIGKNMIFWRKMVTFHTKYPKTFSRLPPLGAIFLSAPPNLKSWIHPWLLQCKDMPHYIMTQRGFMLYTTIHTPLSKIFQLLLLWQNLEYPEKTTDLWQVTGKLWSHNVFSSTPRHEWGSNSQLKWW
jgi:hypothetical protein